MSYKLSDNDVKKITKENPNQPLDICSICDGVELHLQMSELKIWCSEEEVNWDLICDDCKELEKEEVNA